jgi:hypothetical protein
MHSTAAQINVGPPGKKGEPPIIKLTAAPKHGTWMVPAGTKLSTDQYKEFRAGDHYRPPTVPAPPPCCAASSPEVADDFAAPHKGAEIVWDNGL